jgi:uncharacterized membrane protein
MRNFRIFGVITQMVKLGLLVALLQANARVVPQSVVKITVLMLYLHSLYSFTHPRSLKQCNIS